MLERVRCAYAEKLTQGEGLEAARIERAAATCRRAAVSRGKSGGLVREGDV